MVSGAFSRVMGQLCLHPADTVKTRLQFQGTRTDVRAYTSAIHACRTMVQEEGALSLYRGLSSRLLYVVPAAAMNFFFYERLKTNIQAPVQSGTSPLVRWMDLAGSGFGLFASRVLGSVVRTPFDVVKQRQQVHGALRLGNLTGRNSILHILQDFRLSLFSMTHASLLRDLPFMFLSFSSYEASIEAQRRILARDGGVAEIWTPHHLIAGAFSGFFACVLTNPLDVVKTRMQVQQTLPVEKRPYQSIRHCFSRVMQEEGLAGFAQGLRPRLAYCMSLSTIIWVSYEATKKAFSRFRVTRSLEAASPPIPATRAFRNDVT